MRRWHASRCAVPRTLAGTAAALLVSCAPRIHSSDPCAAPLVAMSDWQEARGSIFTMRLPPGFHRVAVQGIDSEVGEWSDGQVTIGYDYGWYSDRLENAPEGASAVEICGVTIGGRPARVRRYRSVEGEYRVEAHWPPDKTTEREGRRGADESPESSLTLFGGARTPRDANLLVAIIHSVRFRQAAGDEPPLPGARSPELPTRR